MQINYNSPTIRHGTATEMVAMTPQGYVKIAELIKWLYENIKVHVSMSDITRIAQYYLKARYKILNGKICAVNRHSLDLPLMTFPMYSEGIGGRPRYLVHKTYIKCLPAILKEGLSRMGRNHIECHTTDISAMHILYKY